MVTALIFVMAITIDWSNNNVTDETGFLVERTVSGNCTDGFTRLAIMPANSTVLGDPSAAPGDCYRVAAFNDGGILVYSNTSQIPLPPPPPPQCKPRGKSGKCK